jgi:hypothetical protein
LVARTTVERSSSNSHSGQSRQFGNIPYVYYSLAPGRATLASHEPFAKRSPTGEVISQGRVCRPWHQSGFDTLFVGVFDPHHYPRSCRHGSIDQQRGVYSLPRSTPLMESMVRGETNSNRKGTCTVRASCRQRGQRRKLIRHTSLLVYVATVTVTPHFFSGAPPFFAGPSIQITRSTV